MLAIGRVVDPLIYMGLFDFLCLFCKHYSPLRSTLLQLLAWSIKGALRQISYIYNGLYLPLTIPLPISGTSSWVNIKLNIVV